MLTSLFLLFLLCFFFGLRYSCFLLCKKVEVVSTEAEVVKDERVEVEWWLLTGRGGERRWKLHCGLVADGKEMEEE